MGGQLIGWLAAVVLLSTITAQTLKQWRSGSNDGVSSWLFGGQALASAGFLAYAVLKSDHVFMATNGLMLLSALAGAVIMSRNRARQDGSAAEQASLRAKDRRRAGQPESGPSTSPT